MKLTKLDKENKSISATTFGIPYGKGEMHSQELNELCMYDSKGRLECDIFPMAYWPDKSVKWAGISTAISNDNEYFLRSGKKKDNVKVENSREGIKISTPKIKVSIVKTSENITEKIVDVRSNVVINKQFLKLKSEGNTNNIKKISCEIENKYLNRVLVKQRYAIGRGSINLYYIDVRMYVYSNTTEIKYVVTLYIDKAKGDNIIKSIGICSQTNLFSKVDSYNQFIRFSLESGPYCEPLHSLASRKFRESNKYYSKQLKALPQEIDSIPSSVTENSENNAIWRRFSLEHNNPYSYKLSKCTKNGYEPIIIDQGLKSNGSLSLSDGKNELRFIPTNFWEKYPAATEVNCEEDNNSYVTNWLVFNNKSTFNHYSDRHHVECYEGFDFVRSDATGIANTSEFHIKICSSQSNREFYEYSRDKQKPNILVACKKQYINSKSAGLIGHRIEGENKIIEDAMQEILHFYDQEIKERNWYGYWNYGDIMHTFDNHRGQWWYDMGGYAWQNTELNPNMWLWYSFLRNQDLISYKMAYNMTRHNTDTDVYHFGEYKGLGSRHNVLHYGCSCKEPRIGMAHLHRIFYYLHCDERVGEMLDIVSKVEETMDRVGPYDQFYKKEKNKIYMRIGPDWFSLCSNWFVKYERTLEEKYIAQIKCGLDSINKFKYNLLEGPVVKFDIRTYKLKSLGAGLGGYHMVVSFGGPQVLWDLYNTFEYEELLVWVDEFAQQYFRSEKDTSDKYKGVITTKNFDWKLFAAGMLACSAYYRNSEQVLEDSKKVLFDEMHSDLSIFISRRVQRHKELYELEGISTNCAAQWCLNAIQIIGYEQLINKSNKNK